MSDTSPRFPRPLQRTRLYEQVAEQISSWIRENGLRAGDRLPPERELASRLGVSRATLSQALVALEVVGVVAVRHGDGTVLTDKAGSARIADAIRAHADRMPDVIEARDALETKLAELAAERRTEEDLAAIDAALDEMAADIEAGGRGVHGDERFHGAVTAAAHSPLLASMMAEIARADRRDPDRVAVAARPTAGLAGRPPAIADAIRAGDPAAACLAMHDHVQMVSDVALLRERP